MSQTSRTCVAVYRRTVEASIERAWENVFDWEHLPWLHRESFSRIEHVESGRWGWRAKIGLHPPGGGEILLELVLDCTGDRYVARTLEGPGAGTEIWTRLSESSAVRTNVEVEFHVPDVPPDSAEAIGAAFTRLYTRLWDEDEAMMVHRTRELESLGSPAAQAAATSERELGTLAELRARLPLVVEFGGAAYRIVAVGDELAIHACACPHWLGPLDDCPVEDGRIRCPWHGYEFDIRSGRSTDGRRLRLRPAPRLAVDPASGSVRLTQ